MGLLKIGCWSHQTGARSIQCKYCQILLGQTYDWFLWRGGCFTEVLFKTGLTVISFLLCISVWPSSSCSSMLFRTILCLFKWHCIGKSSSTICLSNSFLQTLNSEILNNFVLKITRYCEKFRRYHNSQKRLIIYIYSKTAQ